MNSKDFELGDILKATHRDKEKGRHYIIYISGHSEQDFVGAMITHLQDITKNVWMVESHFEPNYPINYDESLLVRGRFIKPENWGTFKKVGKLTKKGIDFLKEVTDDLPTETFADYYVRINIKN